MCFRPASVEIGKTCPKCGTKTKPIDKVCLECGFELSVGPTMPGAPGVPGAPKAPGIPEVPKAPGAK